MNLEKIKPASAEIVERMKKLRAMPKPRLQDVLTQMKASAEYRKNKEKSPRG